MRTQFILNETAEPVVIFPPATNRTCKLETWSATPINASCDAIVGKNEVSNVFRAEGDEEDAERWDGMS